MPRTTHVPETICPNCGRKNDAATHPTEDVAPTPGDLSVCLGCQELMRFDDHLKLVKPGKHEMETIFREQPELRALVSRLQRTAAQVMDKGPNE